MFITKREIEELKYQISCAKINYDILCERVTSLRDEVREYSRELSKQADAFKILGIERHVQKADVYYRKIPEDK